MCGKYLSYITQMTRTMKFAYKKVLTVRNAKFGSSSGPGPPIALKLCSTHSGTAHWLCLDSRKIQPFDPLNNRTWQIKIRTCKEFRSFMLYCHIALLPSFLHHCSTPRSRLRMWCQQPPAQSLPTLISSKHCNIINFSLTSLCHNRDAPRYGCASRAYTFFLTFTTTTSPCKVSRANYSFVLQVS